MFCFSQISSLPAHPWHGEQPSSDQRAPGPVGSSQEFHSMGIRCMEGKLFVRTNSVLWYFRFKRGHFSVLKIGVPKIFSYSNTHTTGKTHSSRCLWSARFPITLPGAHPFPCTEERISDCHGWACGTFTILTLLSLY